jgi:hypothetical protein
MTGALLMDAYRESYTQSKKPLPFTEEYLKFVDPKYTYSAFVKAKLSGFTTGVLDGRSIPLEKKYPVTDILGERWSIIASGRESKESRLLERWWRALGKQLPAS